MKKFLDVVREVKQTMLEMTLFANIINTVVIFLFFFLAFSLLNVSGTFALIPAALYLTFIVVERMRQNQFRIVEKEYPILDEKLRTAADYAAVDNVVVNELHKDVMSDLKKVSTSSFLNTKKSFFKIVLVAVLCFAIITTASVKIRIPQKNETIGAEELTEEEKLEKYKIEGGLPGENGIGGVAGKTEVSNIYGEKTVAKLGERVLKIEINPSTYEYNVRGVEDTKEREFNPQFPGDITAKEAPTYTENIPKEQQEIVKAYFKKLTSG